jgi:hypothetical protein
MRPCLLLHAALLMVAFASPSLRARSRSAPECTGTVYGQGRRAICLPQGTASFADSVVSFTPGARPSEAVWVEPHHALDEPDYTRTTAPGILSLGCDGVLVVRFDDNALVDVNGPDLNVFEVGPAVEATELAVPVDGRAWLEVGRIEGARAELELTGLIDPDDVYRYARLINRSRTCGGRHSGADIVRMRGHGERRPVAPNDTPANKARNRRVDLLVR